MEPVKTKEPEKTPIRLRTIDDLTTAHEWLFNSQKNNEIDSKTADALNTTLKGITYLRVKLRLDALKIFTQASIKKVEIPKYLLPEGLMEPSKESQS